jgi:flagellar assembly factor FliW
VKIETTRFGTVDVPEEKVITMPQGLLGFPDKRRFCIFQQKKTSPFLWYQSLDDPALAFAMTNPWLFKPDYQVDLELAIQAMGWDGNVGHAPLECYVIVTIPRGAPDKMTANLVGPVVLNPNNREALQIILANEGYSHKHPLLKKKAA